MSYTKEQQSKIDTAQKILDAAKATYQGWVTSYNGWVASIQPCYKNTIPDSSAASTWFNHLDTGPCTSAGNCKQSDVANCKAVIDKTLNPITIPTLKTTYTSLNAAQANYDKVLAAVIAESKNDPATVLQEHQIDAAATVSKYKWVFAIVVVIILVIGFFVYKKFFKKS